MSRVQGSSAVAERPTKHVTEMTALEYAAESQRVAREAQERQRKNKPARPDRKFAVSAGAVAASVDKPEVYEAQTPEEAWAKFCDKNKVYPSPKTGRVDEIK